MEAINVHEEHCKQDCGDDEVGGTAVRLLFSQMAYFGQNADHDIDMRLVELQGSRHVDRRFLCFGFDHALLGRDGVAW
jgi:hypothetical protein